MTPRTRLEAFPLTITEAQLAEQLVGTRHSRFPIYSHDVDHIVGILRLKDYLRHRMTGAGTFRLRELLTEPRYIPDGMPLDQVLNVFKDEKLSLAVVLDEFGGTAGLVTLEDLIEEVVGDVQDEFDEARVSIQQRRPGVLAVRGEVQLADLDDYGVPLEADRPDVDTVGGLVLALLGRPARRGDRVQLGPVTFKVEKVQERAVDRVRVEYPSRPPGL